jgi:phage terminase large subunit
MSVASPAATATFRYEPRAGFTTYHQRDRRFALIVAHRRCGKTVATVADLILRALYTRKRNAQYAFVAPTYGQAKRVAFRYLLDFTEAFATSTSLSDLSVTLPNGATIRLLGADNPDSLRGQYLDGCVVDEVAQCPPRLVSSIILPSLADREGHLTLIGTPNGKTDDFYRYHETARADPAWYFLSLPVTATDALPPAEIELQRKSLSAHEFAREFLCSFDAPVVGAVYGEVIDSISVTHDSTLIDPLQPTHAAFDLGYADHTAIWRWQSRPDGLLIVDAFSDHLKPIGDYISYLFDRPQKLGDVWLPHDARAKSLQTGRSIVEQFIAAGIRPRLVPPAKMRDGIDAVRQVLPACRFYEPATKDGLEALRSYRYEWDDARRCYGEKPVHDHTSHYADAFRYFALATGTFHARTNQQGAASPPNVFPLRPRPPGIYTFDNLLQDNPYSKRSDKRI